MSVYVSIGRNVGAEPMSEPVWNAFRGTVREVVELTAGPIVSDTVGTGFYDGAEEETAVLVGAGSDRTGALRRALAIIAHAFEQDSIALADVEPAFVEAEKGRDNVR